MTLTAISTPLDCLILILHRAVTALLQIVPLMEHVDIAMELELILSHVMLADLRGRRIIIQEDPNVRIAGAMTLTCIISVRAVMFQDIDEVALRIYFNLL